MKKIKIANEFLESSVFPQLKKKRGDDQKKKSKEHFPKEQSFLETNKKFYKMIYGEKKDI